MSKEIDERVVQLTFDNSNFESKAKESMSTLDRIKSKLNFDSILKGFSNIGKAVDGIDFSGVTASAEDVSSSLSALEVIGTGALLRIGQQAIDTGEKLVKNLTIDQLASGWNKYTEKTASVQTIMNATGKSIDEVNKYLEKLMWFSDETSYGFTDMTQAIGMMTSSGGKIENLIPMVMGVANATAYAGKGAREFSHVMYNLNQSYGTGHLQLMDWKSVELMGVGSKQLKQVLIDTAEELGTIEKGTMTVGKFNASLRNAWVTQEVMEKGFGKFATMMEDAYELVESGEFETARDALDYLTGSYEDYVEKATKAAQEAKSFTEAIEATKDAVSTGWLTTFEIIFGNYEKAKVLWSGLADSLWDIFASGAEERNNILRDAFEGTDAFITKEDWLGLTEGSEQAGLLAETMRRVAIDHGVAIDEMMADETSFADTLDNGWLTKDIFNDFITQLKGTSEESKKVQPNLEELLSTYTELSAHIIRGDYGNGADRVKALAEAGYDYATAQDIVNKRLKGAEITIEDVANATSGLSDEQLALKGYTEEQIQQLRDFAKTAEETGTPLEELMAILNKPTAWDLLFNNETGALFNILNGIIDIIDSVKTAIRDVFGPATSETIWNIANVINQVSQAFVFSETEIDNFQDVLRGILTVVKLLTDAFGFVVKMAFTLAGSFRGIFDIFLSVSGTIGSLVYEFGEIAKATGIAGTIFGTCEAVLSLLVDSFSNLATAISDSIHKVRNTEIFQKLLDIFKGIASVTGDVFTFIPNILLDAIGAIDYFGRRGASGFEEAGGAVEYFKGVLEDFKISFDKSFAKISESEAFAALKTAFEGLTSVVKAFYDVIKTAFRNLGISVSDILSDFLNVNNIVEVFENGAFILIDVMTSLLKSITGFVTGIKNTNIFTDLSKGISEFLTSIFKGSNGQEAKIKTFGNILTTVTDWIKEIGQNIANFDYVGTFTSFVTGISDCLGIFYKSVFNVLTPAIQQWQIMFGSKDLALNALGLAEIFLIYKAVKAISDAISGPGDELANVLESVSNFIDKAAGALKGFARAAQWKALAELIKSLGISVALLAGSLFVLSKADTGELAIAGAVLSGVAIALGIFAKKMADFSSAKGTATIIGLTIALNLLMIPLAILGHMDFMGTIVPGLASLGILLVELAVATRILDNNTAKFLAFSAAVAVLAVGLTALTVPIAVLSKLDTSGLFQSLFTIATVLVTTAVTAPGINIFSNAILKMAASFAIIAIGIPVAVSAIVKALLDCKKLLDNFDDPISVLQAFGVAFVAFVGAVGVVALITPIISKLGSSVLKMGAGLAIGTAAILALTAAVVAFSKMAPAIGAAVTTMIQTLSKVIIDSAPYVAEAVFSLIDAVLASLANHAYTIAMSIVRILSQILSAVVDIFSAGVGGGMAWLLEKLGFGESGLHDFFAGMRDSASKNVEDQYVQALRSSAQSQELWAAAREPGEKVNEALAETGKETAQIGLDSVDGYTANFTDSKTKKRVGDAATELGDEAIISLLNSIPGFQGASEAQIQAYLKELKANMPEVVETGELLPEGLAEGMETGMKHPLISARKGIDDIVKAAQDEAEIHSPSRVMRDEVGKWLVDGIAEGIEKNTSAEDAARIKADNIASAFQEAFDKIDLNLDRINLQFQLWTAQQPVTKEPLEQLQYDLVSYKKKSEVLTEQIDLQTERMEYAKGQYQVMVDTFGEASDETENAFNTYLQEQVNLANMKNELVDLAEQEFQTKLSEYDTMITLYQNRIDIIDKEAELVDSMLPSSISYAEDMYRDWGDRVKAVSEAEKTLIELRENVQYREQEAADAIAEAEENLENVRKANYENDRERRQAIRQAEKELKDAVASREAIYKEIEDAERQRESEQRALADQGRLMVKNYQTANVSLKKFGLQMEVVREAREKYIAVQNDERASAQEVNEAYQNYIDAQKTVNDLITTFGDSVGLPDWATTLVANVNTTFTKLNEDPKFQAAMSKFADGIAEALGGKENAEAIKKGLMGLFGEGGDMLTGIASIITGISSGDYGSAITGAFETIGAFAGTEFGQEFISNLMDELLSDGGILTLFGNIIDMIIDLFKNGFGDIADIAMSFFGNLFGGEGKEGKGGGFISTLIDGGTKLLTGGGGKILSGIAEAAGPVLSGIAEAAGPVLSGIAEAAVPVLAGGAIVIGGNWLGSALYDWAEDWKKEAKETNNVLLEAAASFVQGGTFMNKFLADVGGSIWNWITGDDKKEQKESNKQAKKQGKETGGNIVDGLVQGIGNGLKAVGDAIWDVGTKVVDGVKNFFGIHSPSTLMAEMGDYLMKGFGLGISKSASIPLNSVMNLGNSIIDSMRYSLNAANTIAEDNLNTEFKIKPIVDLDDVFSKRNAIGELFSMKDLLFDIGSIFRFTRGRIYPDDAKPAEPPVQTINNEYNFEQTNNSPKALSSSEIYRQTRNQISLMREAVKA